MRIRPAVLPFTIVAIGSLVAYADDRVPQEDRPAAIEPSGSRESQSVRSIEISGRVQDESDQPIAGATVRVYHRDQAEGGGEWIKEVGAVQTEADGLFRFADLALVGDEQDSERNSFAIVVTSDRHASAMRSIFDVQPTQDVTIKLLPAGSLTGTIRNAAGKPVAGAVVYIGSLGLANEPIPGVWSDATDDNGRYEIADLGASSPKPNSWAIFQVRHSSQGMARGKFSGIPSVVDVQLEPAATIEGRVIDSETGRPWSGATVAAQGTENHVWAQAVTDESGRYRLTPLPEDRYNVWASAPGRTVIAIDRFSVRTGETQQAPDLRLTPGGFVTGRLTDATTGKPVCRMPSGEPIHVGVHGPSRPRSGAAVAAAKVRNDGTYRLRVAPGENYVYLMRQELTAAGSQTVTVNLNETITVDFTTPAGAAVSTEEASQAQDRRSGPP